MLSPDAFETAYPAEELADELPDSPIGSLRDLQYLYGKLYTLATTGGGEYAPYLTPDAAGDLVDTESSLIVVRVDVSGGEPKLADEPVRVTRYTENLVQKVSHCKYSAARGIDHSVTHQAGRNSDAEKLARYAKKRLTKWATDDIVTDAADTHPDGWIVDQLAVLAEDEDALETIEDAVVQELGGDSATALLTVQVKTDGGGDYRWPGDIDVFLEAMRQRKLSKLVTKNKADDSSGDATDIVTGQPARTVGTSEDPQNYFLGKQRETFPGLDIEEAWRAHPISEDAAVTVMNAETFVEACTYRTFGTKVYYLPYFFGRPTAERAYELYGLLYQAATDGGMETPIEDAYATRRGKDLGENDLRFYVSAVMPHQMSRYDVFGETLNGQLHYPTELAFAHNEVVGQASAFNSDADWTPPLPTTESWDLLTDSTTRLNSVSTGWYFYQTFAERDDADADADDPRIEALVNVLSGEPIAVEMLLEEYVQRIIDEQTDDSEHEGFPSLLVASQFAQLCALADEKTQLLTTTDPAKDPITQAPTYEKHTSQTMEEIDIVPDGGHPGDAKLESFIENTPALTPDPDDEDSVANERRGAFLLGALVGDIGSYQEYSEDRSTTLVDQYPVKSITQSRIKKVAQETIAKTLTYTRQEKKKQGDYPGTKADHIVDRLRETIVDPDPDEWEIDTDDLRFYYALGVTYGMNDHPWNNGNAQTDDQSDLEEEH
ncbi:type I-B CRISPR-associated protein Cas8b/Csh1 [Natronobacterium gregoryi]|uniref:CRISPR-associated protein Cas8b/Csh1, subtype I-B/HMARI n=2 Tax=Natronobacterium gregoryi TaxID=44930 RepID=L0ANC1_NATGS|nr:type I-B CRISPR-associated protein Cas8b/Csh1 [Natronobacterium gregoryi]AFZ74575.1 CRISPR-associated protein Cas8b/Csh1, subtype I-B/HMARI [Natronobacterium gregoryi SP2]ELY72601.1 CRISPR-associated protein, Csh1 family [Natronobacterium gregoryi SP2]PLK21683.1 type I-B CRISPR-associated protein Cas8b/Csh1 [Natronobacterium gregoryi SP2]SFI94887.1 CRISPR-associated protein, Csh1 family [Natronobacterium gregoryi]